MLTVTAIKADVGSIGGHTQPSSQMMELSRDLMARAAEEGIIIDFDVTHTGDDICLLMVHGHGNGAPEVHNLAWHVFEAATDKAREEGLYGAGQDLLADAPSGNVRGAGPGAAEMTFDPEAKERPAEPFLVFTADKCGPGAFNFPLWAVFTNPMYCAGLLMPKNEGGFSHHGHRHGTRRRGSNDQA
jgi:fructose 1,6-bisphosphate aldolase/phosphatase